jgi:hypothetical protein
VVGWSLDEKRTKTGVWSLLEKGQSFVTLVLCTPETETRPSRAITSILSPLLPSNNSTYLRQSRNAGHFPSALARIVVTDLRKPRVSAYCLLLRNWNLRTDLHALLSGRSHSPLFSWAPIGSDKPIYNTPTYLKTCVSRLKTSKPLRLDPNFFSTTSSASLPGQARY